MWTWSPEPGSGPPFLSLRPSASWLALDLLCSMCHVLTPQAGFSKLWAIRSTAGLRSQGTLMGDEQEREASTLLCLWLGRCF